MHHVLTNSARTLSNIMRKNGARSTSTKSAVLPGVVLLSQPNQALLLEPTLAVYRRLYSVVFFVSIEMISTLCVYVPENDDCDTTYVHFYPYEMYEAEQTRDRLQKLYPSADVRIFERELYDSSYDRVYEDRSLR